MSALTGRSQLSSVTGSDVTGGQAVPAKELPKPSVQAIDYLYSIEVSDFAYLMFDDKLVTMSDTQKELGEFSISISETKHHGEDCFLVLANSHGAIDNVPCGTSITAYISKKLETLEQQHHEYVKLENHPLDRKTFILKEDQNYVVNRVITQGDDVQRSTQLYNIQDMECFISEGSNLLLQRLFVRKGMPESLQFLSFDSESQLCPTIYKSLDKRTQTVDGAELDVIGVERTIVSTTDLPTTWQSYYMVDGHLTSRVQVGSPVTMRLVVVPQTIEDDSEGQKPVFERKPINIDEDIEMCSKILDRKLELKNDHAVYMRQHPELKSLLADFTQFLLLRKPDDVLEFAADYFSTHSCNMPDTTAYLESAHPTPFPMSRTNSKIQYLSRTNTGV